MPLLSPIGGLSFVCGAAVVVQRIDEHHCDLSAAIFHNFDFSVKKTNVPQNGFLVFV
jgi:hypothetical protein